ncbi:MAG: hypothetical protein ABL949_07315 [Fimbriimonadaceae bacterium]
MYYPLAISWLFMGLEGPIIVKMIGTVGNAEQKEVWLAAFNALLAISLIIESPVIDLLSTSTTLCKGRVTFASLSKFSLQLMGLCTIVHALVVFTPLYGLITAHYDPAVRDALHVPLMVMLPWSAAIGWRRFKQGILIRSGRTRMIGFGTGVRVGTLLVVSFGLAQTTQLTGVMISAIALASSVFTESLFVHFAAAEAIENLEGGDEPLAPKKLVSFHTPLTVTTAMVLGSNFLVTQSLAASADHKISHAAYQVALSFMWLHRAVVFALPEVIITLYDRVSARPLLHRFSALVSLSMTGLMLFWGLTGIDYQFFRTVLGQEEGVARAAHWAFLGSSLLPAINGAQAYVRGVLTAGHFTKPRMTAMGVGLAVMAVTLLVGLKLQASGILLSAIAPTLAFAAELAVLIAALRKLTPDYRR